MANDTKCECHVVNFVLILRLFLGTFTLKKIFPEASLWQRWLGVPVCTQPIRVQVLDLVLVSTDLGVHTHMRRGGARPRASETMARGPDSNSHVILSEFWYYSSFLLPTAGSARGLTIGQLRHCTCSFNGKVCAHTPRGFRCLR